MEENKINLQDLQESDAFVQSFVQSDGFAGIMKAAVNGIQDAVDPKVLGLRTSTWKKVGWTAAAVGAVAVVGYGAYKFFGEDGGTVTDGTSGAPAF